MRKTSFGLGLAGSILALIIAVIMMFAALAVTVISDVDWIEVESSQDDVKITINDEEVHVDIDGDFDGRLGGRYGGFPFSFIRLLGGWLWIAAAAAFIGGVLGIIGTVITRRKQSKLAGVLLIIAAVLCTISLYGFHATVLLIPSGILAFLKDKPKSAQQIET